MQHLAVMNRWSFPVVASLALLTLFLSSPALAQTCQTHTGLTYGTYVDASGATQPLLLELLVPQGVAGPVPVVLWIHGGGWRTGSRLPVPTRASNLCARGYAVASVDYRLTTTALWPAQIQDVRGAVRWLRAHAPEYNLDADRFGAWGDSAGGHLAAFLAFSGGVGTVTMGSVTVDLEGSIGDGGDGGDGGGNLDQSSRVQAVVDWYGATDVLQMHFYPTTVNHDGSGSDESRFLGGPIQDRPELAATANPITYVDAGDPPLLVMHGTLDKLIPFNQSQLLVDAVRDAGVSARLYPVQGAGHGGASAFDKPAILETVYSFFDSILRGSSAPGAGAPTVQPPNPPGPVTLAASDRFAAESGADGGGRITVTRSGSTTSPLTVAYTVSGTAMPGADYAGLPGTVTIPAGQTSANVDVTPLDDNLYETGETVILTVGSSSASVVIRDVEPVRPVVAVSLSDQDAAEPSDTGEFIVWRTGSTTDPLTVDLIQGGTASGSDYDLPGSATAATIPAGSDRVLLKVTPISDTLVEDPETVTLAVAAASTIYPGPYAGSTVTLADGPPLALASLTLTPATFTGGCRTSTGKVTLTDKASPGGVVVALANTNPVAQVPPSVTVPAGSNSATFTITAPAVTANQTGTVTASYAGKSLGGTLTVKPVGLASLALSPNPVAGPATVTGTVTLECAAPGAVTVSLSSSSPGVANPTTPSLTVPAGSTQGTFTVTAADVSIQSYATIKAVAGGTTRSVKLTVDP